MEQQGESDGEYDAEGDDGEMVYPPELLEFLEYCVQEHGDNWEAISGDFMDIAMELEEPLVERATEAFSPEALRRRWLQLLEEEGLTMDNGDKHHRADEEKQDGGAEAALQVPDEDVGDRGTVAAQGVEEVPLAVEEAPVGKGVEAAPSRPGWMDLMDSGSEAPSGFSIFKDSLKEQIDKIYLEVQSKLPSTVMDGDDEDEEEAEDGEDKDGEEQDALRDDAEDTDAGAKQASSAVQASSAQVEGAVALANEEASLAEHAKEKQKLMTSASPGNSGTLHRDARVHRGTRGRRGDVDWERLDDTAQDDDDDEAASIGGDSSSADEEFMQMRQNMKQSSLEILSSPSAPASSSSAPMVFAPKPRLPEQPRQEAKARPARGQSQQASLPQQKFVTLELQASSEDEASSGYEDEDAPEGGSEAGDNDDEYAEDEEHLRVMRRLLARAPEGEGAWDVWLEATQAWPRLQLRLGAPTFFQHNGDLRVSFDASKLRELLEEEQRAVIAERQHQKEQAAQLSSRTAEFVREAEKRREELAKRIGSFVLSSQRSEIQAT